MTIVSAVIQGPDLAAVDSVVEPSIKREFTETKPILDSENQIPLRGATVGMKFSHSVSPGFTMRISEIRQGVATYVAGKVKVELTAAGDEKAGKQPDA